jgi:hypothetical protein
LVAAVLIEIVYGKKLFTTEGEGNGKTGKGKRHNGVCYNSRMRWLFFYLILLLCATAKVVSVPEHSFDGYMYSYLASHDVQEFKSTAGVPPEYVAIPDQTYSQQAPFYRVKVFYVALVRGAAKVFGALRAPFVVSAIAYFLLGLVTWLWLRTAGVPEPWRSAAGLLLMFSSVTTDTARMGTPDMLCTLLLVSGAWVLLFTRYSVYAAALFILSVLTRTDCLIAAALLVALAWRQKRLSARFTGVVVLLFGVAYVAVSRIGYSYGQLLAWTIRTSYWSGFLHGFAKTELAIYAPFALLALIALKRGYQRELIAVCAVSLAIRYILLPHLEIRYLLPQAMIAGIVGAASVLGRVEQASIPAEIARATTAN